MNDLSLLIKHNTPAKAFSKIKLDHAHFVYIPSTKLIDFNEILDIIKFIHSIYQKYGRIPLPVELRLGSAQFADKLTITLLECICQHIILFHNQDVKLQMHPPSSISTEGIYSSPLQLLTSPKLATRKMYPSKFELEIYKNHYRRVCSANDIIGTSFLSKVFDDIVTFQLPFDINEADRETIAEILVELVGNACEHTHADCLLDIDITNNYNKKNTPGDFFGINISIVNFSEQLFSHAIESKFLSSSSPLPNARYEYVKQAHQNHIGFFNSTYLPDDFFTIAAFQHKISGRTQSSLTGGTGLTKLVKGIQLRSDAHRCFMNTGYRRLAFLPKYLEYNSDDWIGFNESNNFLDSPPDTTLFESSTLYIPGTAYNLTFVMKKGS